MRIMDSSFLPFGNDLLVVALVVQGHQYIWIYALTAAAGSTCGALLLVLVSRPLGEAGMKKLAGVKRFDQLQRWLKGRAAVAIAVGALAPPPFPYTVIVGAAGAMEYSLA